MIIKCPIKKTATPEECIKCGKCLPKPIIYSLVSGNNHKRKFLKIPRIGVTYLVNPCLRKSYYQITEEVPIELEKLWIFSRGHAIHNFFQKDLPKKEVEVFLEKKFQLFKTIGYADAIHDNVLYEFKTINNLPNVPQNSHILQAQAYYSILPLEIKEKLLDIKLIYFSLSGIRVFNIPKRDISSLLEAKGTILSQAIKLGKPPRRQRSFLCDYCEYRDICEDRKNPSFNPEKIIFE